LQLFLLLAISLAVYAVALLFANTQHNKNDNNNDNNGGESVKAALAVAGPIINLHGIPAK